MSDFKDSKEEKKKKDTRAVLCSEELKRAEDIYSFAQSKKTQCS